MSRVENWPSLLTSEIESAQSRTFEPGVHDCVTWAFHVAFALLGEKDPEWMGGYKTEKGGLRRLANAGLELDEIGTKVFGDPLENPLFAQRGDVVFSGGAYGICGGKIVYQPGPDGLRYVPLSKTDIVWRV